MSLHCHIVEAKPHSNLTPYLSNFQRRTLSFEILKPKKMIKLSLVWKIPENSFKIRSFISIWGSFIQWAVLLGPFMLTGRQFFQTNYKNKTKEIHFFILHFFIHRNKPTSNIHISSRVKKIIKYSDTLNVTHTITATTPQSSTELE